MSNSTVNLWRQADYLRFWSAATIANFGSMMRHLAIPWVAILVLDAEAGEIALLRTADLLPGLVIGLWAGVWADRFRRRRLLIASDLIRAALLILVPAAAWVGFLDMRLLVVVVCAVSVMAVVFGVAHRAYLPSLVARDSLAEANGKLAAGESVAEAAAFPAGGWLVQLSSAPLALLVNAFSFLASALLLARISTPEPIPAGDASHERRFWRETAEGIRAVFESQLLRALAAAGVLNALAFSILSVVYLLYASRELGFEPGLLGTIFALGSLSSVVGAMSASRVCQRVGFGPAVIAGLALGGIAVLFLPLAASATLAGVLLLCAHQLVGDGPETIAQIGSTTLIQTITPRHLLGRVNGSLELLGRSGSLIGVGLGGLLGEWLGLRATIAISGLITLATALALVSTPLRRRALTAPGNA